MKKVIALFLMAALCACSSDSNEINTPSQELTQYEVDFIAYKDDFKYTSSHLYSSSVSEQEFITGRTGVWVMYYKEQSVAFDYSCPVEWKDNKTGKLNRIGYDEENERGWISCKECGSKFSYISMEALSGKAKELGFKLMRYKVDYDAETGNCHVTNPNYK